MSYHDVVRDVVRVKCMGRISDCKHNIVRDIYKGVDRPHSGFPDPVLHFVRRRLHAHAGHLNADVSCTSVRRVDLNLKIRLDVCLKRFDFFERQVIERRDLARDPVMSPEIRSVRH